MLDAVYRFRPVQRLLGEGYNELEEQVIYFASPAELNDPFEGHKKIYWQGDAIVWKNLLQHYLRCLTLKLTTKLIDPNAADASHAFHRFSELPGPMAEMCACVCTEFFLRPELENFPQKLAARKSPVSRHELSIYLRCIQGHAFATIFKALENVDLLSDFLKSNLPIDKSFIPLDCVIQSLDLAENLEKAQHDLLIAGLITNAEFLRLGRAHPNQSHLIRQSFASFPDDYIKQLEELLYYNWYTACFVTEPDNSAMWANYAEGHKGVCLKFKTKPTANGIPALNLLRMNGFGGSKDNPRPSFGFMDHQIYPIAYSSEHVEVDFFGSLGRLSIPALNEWYRDKEGKISTSAARILTEEAAWRDDYWAKYQTILTTKLSDWAHEKEHRITLHGMALDFTEPATRRLQYKFEDLEGIIFGIKTSHEDKLEIIRIIANKCIKESRTDFRFFQAYYSPLTKRMDNIEIYPLQDA